MTMKRRLEREAELKLAAADAQERHARRAVAGEAPGCGGQAGPVELNRDSGRGQASQSAAARPPRRLRAEGRARLGGADGRLLRLSSLQRGEASEIKIF
jgi:hypothetical protein